MPISTFSGKDQKFIRRKLRPEPEWETPSVSGNLHLNAQNANIKKYTRRTAGQNECHYNPEVGHQKCLVTSLPAYEWSVFMKVCE